MLTEKPYFYFFSEIIGLMKRTKAVLLPEIESFIDQLKMEEVPDNRKIILVSFIDYLKNKVEKKEDVRLHFICTHNSRRSLLAQVWAQTMAHYCSVKYVQCYSGGTVATGIYPMILEALRKSGFQITNLAKTENPVYSIKYASNEHPIIGFSKTVVHPLNPTSAFVAVMNCSQADEECPVIPGAEIRFTITYDDPKEFDNTPHQIEKYMERNLQIATEFLYIFSHIHS